MHIKCVHIKSSHTENKLKHGFLDSHQRLKESLIERRAKEVLDSLKNKVVTESDSTKRTGQKKRENCIQNI